MLQPITKINHLLAISGEFAISPMIELSGEAVNKLSGNEREELLSFKNKQRTKEYLTSRVILKKLARDIGMEEDEFLIEKDALGRPCGKYGKTDYGVSIAHTREQVFCGITPQLIGVDLEPVNRRVPERLSQRMMHPAEASLFKKLPPIRLWTLKEAFIKLEGQGLRMNMNEVLIQQDNDEFFVEINNDKRAKICSFQAEKNWLAVAYYQEF